MAFNITGTPEMWLGAALLVLLVLVVLKMLRNRKPDPKMALLLTLMQDFPKDGNSGGGLGGVS